MCLLWLNSFTHGGLQCAWSASILCDALTAASLQNTTPLYGIFYPKLSSYIFEWDREDVQCLKEAKRAEWKSSHSGHAPTEEQLMATISPGELKRHCRRRIREMEEIRSMISGLLESVWELTDTTGLRLVNHDSMPHVWEVQQKHLECLQDPAGVKLYTQVGTLQIHFAIMVD